MSATRLLVLGVLRMYGEAHGYQVRRELLSWSADEWANVAPGSVYHALKKLDRDKLIRATGTEAEAGPDRTRYALTEDGETEFITLLGKGLSQLIRDHTMFNAALTLMPALTRGHVVSLLKFRLSQLDGLSAGAKVIMETSRLSGKPEHVAELFDLWHVHTVTDIDWLRGLVERIEAGKYEFADDSPDHFGSPGRDRE